MPDRRRGSANGLRAQDVHPRLDVVDAMHEQDEVNAWRPPQRIPRRAVRRHRSCEHAEECVARDRCLTVERNRAAPLQDDPRRIDSAVWDRSRLERRGGDSGCIDVTRRGLDDLVNECPLNVTFAQLTGAAGPAASLNRRRKDS